MITKNLIVRQKTITKDLQGGKNFVNRNFAFANKLFCGTIALLK